MTLELYFMSGGMTISHMLTIDTFNFNHDRLGHYKLSTGSNDLTSQLLSIGNSRVASRKLLTPFSISSYYLSPVTYSNRVTSPDGQMSCTKCHQC